MPQVRKRAYLISIYVGKDIKKRNKLEEYFKSNRLDNKTVRKPKLLNEFLRLDYSNDMIRQEANDSQPNDTPSRQGIFAKNVKLYDGINYAAHVPTITTKQDRHPNAGVITYVNDRLNKSGFRYLTGRECLLLMGFDDHDYESIMSGNFKKNVSDNFFSNTKIVKMAGNSIVVPVLEEIFKQLLYIDDHILDKAIVPDDITNEQVARDLSFAI